MVCFFSENSILSILDKMFSLLPRSEFQTIWASNACNHVHIYIWGGERIEQNAIYGVKLPELQAVWAGQGLILPLEK